MKHYVVGELSITDQSWVEDYTKGITRLIEQYGGRYLARTPNVEKLEGSRDLPSMYVIIEFPSREAAESLYSSAEYEPYLQSRQAGASTELMLIPGEDIVKR